MFLMFDATILRFNFIWWLPPLIIFLLPAFETRIIKKVLQNTPLPKIERRGTQFLIFSLFFLLSMINLLSLWRNIFTPTAHVVLTLLVRTGGWLGVVRTQSLYHHKTVLAHLTPLSTPLLLIRFITIIEIISSLIRPLTLGVRLGANLTAGHLILGLVRRRVVGQLIINLLELLVSVVQAYVFSLLLSLYFKEI